MMGYDVKMRIASLLIPIVIFLISIPVHAETSYEVLGGALTQHFLVYDKAAERFDNKVSKDGMLIANPMLAVRRVKTTDDTYTTRSYFAGQNSIGELMGGLGGSTGVVSGPIRIGLAIGAYAQDTKKFYDRDIQSFSMWTGTRIGIVPILGVEFSLDQKITENTRATLYTIVTPIMSVSLIGIGWDL